MVENEINTDSLMATIKDSIRKKQWHSADNKIYDYLKYVPNDPDALMYLGVSKAAQGYEPEGEHHILASLTFNPRNMLAYYHLGVIVLEQGRCILASEAFQRGLSIGPENQALLYQLGRALERLGKYEEAIDAYQQSINSQLDKELTEEDFSERSQEAIKRLQDPKIRTDAETCKE